MISAFILPLVVSIGLPTLIWYLINVRNTPAKLLTPVFEAFSFFFIILAALIPTFIGAYSFVGEKTEKTLEPLLATPTTDDEILLGKSLAALLPVISLIFISATIFMILMDVIIGFLFFPNWNFVTIIFLDSPFACIMSIELSITISSRVTDIRSAQQLAILIIIPFGLLYVLIEIGIITISVDILLVIAGIIALIDIGLFFTSRATFQREEILTKWI
jgi:ABC-2 type transport system permease protein